MNSTFWTYTIGYVLLGISTVLELIFILVKAQRKRLTLAFYFTVLGIALSFETIILIYFKAYYYYPMLVKASVEPFHDALAGNLFSQFSVAATLLLVAFLDLKYYWHFILAAVYAGIEELFLYLGIYRQNWYRSWMTAAILSVSFWIAKKMYVKILQGVTPGIYYLYIFFGLFSLDVITLHWALLLSGYISGNPTILHDPVSGRIITPLLLSFLPTAIVILQIYFSNSKWSRKVLTVSFLYVFFYACRKLNLLWIKEGWFFAIVTLLIVWMYLSVFTMDKLYGRPLKNS